MPTKNAVSVRRIAATLRSGKKIHIPAWVVESGTPDPQVLLLAARLARPRRV